MQYCNLKDVHGYSIKCTLSVELSLCFHILYACYWLDEKLNEKRSDIMKMENSEKIEKENLQMHVFWIFLWDQEWKTKC